MHQRPDQVCQVEEVRVKCKKEPFYLEKKRMQAENYIEENLCDGLDLDEKDSGLKPAPFELFHLPLLQDLEKKSGGPHIHENYRLPLRRGRLPAA